MKYLKMLGLIVVAAMALMALFGASSASAGVWCKTVPVNDKCPADWDFDVDYILTYSLKSGTSSVLKAAFSEVKCGKAHTKYHVTRTGGKGVNPEKQLTELKFEECKCGERTAHITTVSEGKAEVSETGTVTDFGTRSTVQCTGLASCIYGTVSGGTDVGTLTNSEEAGKEAELDVSATLTWSSGAGDSSQFICSGFGDTATWTADLKLTKPTPDLWNAKE